MTAPKSIRQLLSVTAIGLAALLILLALAPNLWMLSRSFFLETADGALRPSLAHWHDAYDSWDRLLALLQNSVITSLGTVAIAIGLGIPIGWLCFRSDAPLRRTVLVIMILVAAQPVYLITTSWMAVSGSAFWFNLHEGWPRAVGAAFMQGMVYAPATVLLCGLGLQRVSPDLEDQARLESGDWTVFWRVTLPLAWRWLAGSAVLVWMLAFMDITVTDLLSARSYPEEIFTQFAMHGKPYPPSTLGVPLLLLAALAAAALVLYETRRDPDESAPSARLASRVALHGWRRPLALLPFGLLLAVYAWPLVALVRRAGGLQQFLTTCRNNTSDLVMSVSIAVPAATLATLAALVLAYALSRGRRGRIPLAIGLAVLLTTAAPVTGIGWLQILAHPGAIGDLLAPVYNSRAILILTQLSRSLGFATLVMLPALRGLPPDQLTVARLEGATWLQTVRHVVIPNTWPALILAWIVAFVLSMGELGAAMLVVPPGTTVVSVRLATQIHAGLYPDVVGLCLYVSLAVILPTLALAALLSRFLHRRWG